MSEKLRARLYLLAVVAMPVALAVLVAPDRIPDRAEDFQRVRTMIAELLIYREQHGTIPATEDGRVDIYRVRFGGRGPGEVFKDEVRDLANDATGVRPTVREVEAGDYRAFGWARARATDVLDPRAPAPVLWDPQPVDGYRVIGYTNLRVRLVPESDVESALALE